jgi:multidrug efflux system membrane fusion protein
MNRTLTSALAILLIIATSVPIWFFFVAIEAKPPRATVRDLGPVPVRGLRVFRRELIPEIVVVGNLEARRRMVISTELGGRIQAVHHGWRPGALVQEGELLIQLDPVDRDLDLRVAGASRSQAQADLRAAEVRALRARAGEAKASELLQVSLREHERYSKLQGAGTESASLLDRVLAERLDAELALENATLELEAGAAALAGAQAALEVAISAEDMARRNLQKCSLRAPFAGRLAGAVPTIGTWVAPGAALGELVDPESLVLAARVSERNLLRIPLGATATLEFPSAGSGAGSAGRVTAIDAVTETAVRHGRVEIEPTSGFEAVPPPGGGDTSRTWLPAGLFGRARIQLQSTRSIWIERQFLVWRRDEPFCFVARDGPEGVRVAEERRLGLGAPHGEGFLVESGLDEGDELLIHPLERLSDGAEITGESTR